VRSHAQRERAEDAGETVTAYLKFDLAKLERLNDPGRFETLSPEKMWDALGDPSPGVMVEIGAGTGVFSAAFLGLAPTAVAYAVDIEDAMLDWMRDNRPEVSDGRLVPLKGQETSVPLPGAIANLVFMVNVHHELVAPELTYTEALRLLRPSGQLLVVDWAARETPKGPPQQVRVTAEAVVEILEHVGFGEVRAHEVLPWHNLVTARATP
jgi:ubiquinone/menaquinone biosynthesis C-methylase UbiE